MRRFWTWFTKEWRQHRRALILLAALLPVCVAGLFWFDRRWFQDDVATFVFLPAVLAAYVLCVGADVFGGELARGTDQALRRLPGVWGPSFLAKLAMLIAAASVLALWACVCVAVAWWLAGEPERALASARLLPSMSGLLLVGPGVAFVVWVAMVSTWLGRPGVASAAAPVLLGLLLLPLAAIARRHPYFLNAEVAWWPVSMGVFVIALIGAWLSYHRGWRHGRGPLRALGWGVAWLCVSGGAAYGLTGWSLHRYLELSPEDPELRIGGAWLGEGERFVFLNAARGDSWHSNRQRSGDTPLRPYRLDLESGEFSPLGDYLDYMETADGFQISWRPTVDRLRLSERGEGGSLWKPEPTWKGVRVLDGGSGEDLDSGQNPDAVYLSRQLRKIPDGAVRWAPVPGSAFANWVVVNDRDEITFRRVGGQHMIVLSASRVLTGEREADGAGESWTLHDIDHGTSTQAAAPPPPEAQVHELGRDHVLVLDADQLRSWDPATGESRSFHWAQSPLRRIEGLQPIGPQLENPAFRLATVREGSYRHALLRIDRERHEVTTVYQWLSLVQADYVGLDADGALWIVEFDRQIVRLGPEPGRREVVFPRL